MREVRGCDIACCIKRPANSPRILDTTIAPARKIYNHVLIKHKEWISWNFFPK
jgi:hypothetical protein